MLSKYEIKLLKNTREKEFIEAINIYSTTTPVDIMTNSNEIAYYLDNPDKSSSRKMFFYALIYNNRTIGFAELAYLSITKTIVVDYMAMQEEYKKNSIFYPFLNMLFQSFVDMKINYNFIVTEISVRNSGNDVDVESAFFKKMIATEDFCIIDALYRHPALADNTESRFDCNLLLKSLTPIKHINKSTYLKIINELYFSHYSDWYKSFMTELEHSNYKSMLNNEYEHIVNTLIKKDIIELISYNVSECKYFQKEHCAYTSSTAGYVKQNPSFAKRRLWFYLPAMAIIIFVISIGSYYLLQKLNISSATFVPLLAAISTFFATVAAAIIAIQYK